MAKSATCRMQNNRATGALLPLLPCIIYDLASPLRIFRSNPSGMDNSLGENRWIFRDITYFFSIIENIYSSFLYKFRFKRTLLLLNIQSITITYPIII